MKKIFNSNFYISLLFSFGILANSAIQAQVLIFSESFETANNTPQINDWNTVCSAPSSGNDAAPNGGNWSLYAIGGNFQGCSPGAVSRIIPCAQNGDIIQIDGWARVDTNYEIGNLIGIGLGTIGPGAIPTVSKFDTSSTALTWTYFSITDTFSINPGEIPVAILFPGETSSFFSCAAFFDLINVSKIGNIYGSNAPFSLSVSVIDSMIISNDTNVFYQWFDCENNYAAINGETNQTFLPSSNGNYAVEISNANCIDTSECVNISSIGLGLENQNNSNFSIYPNPAKDIVNFEFVSSEKMDLTIFNIRQQLVYKNNNLAGSNLQISFNQPKGLYIVQVQYDAKKEYYKLIIE